jgi:hypothetical protein
MVNVPRATNATFGSSQTLHDQRPTVTGPYVTVGNFMISGSEPHPIHSPGFTPWNVTVPPSAVPATPHVVVTVTPSLGLGVGVGVAVGVAVGAVGGATVAATVGVVRAVGTTVEPQADRPTAAIAMPMMVVSFMASPIQRERVTNGYIRANASNVPIG